MDNVKQAIELLEKIESNERLYLIDQRRLDQALALLEQEPEAKQILPKPLDPAQAAMMGIKPAPPEPSEFMKDLQQIIADCNKSNASPVWQCLKGKSEQACDIIDRLQAENFSKELAFASSGIEDLEKEVDRLRDFIKLEIEHEEVYMVLDPNSQGRLNRLRQALKE